MKRSDLAFLFPGQGSQSVGMLQALAQVYPQVEETFVQASEVLDLNLWELVREGPSELLNQTVNTQPAMLAAGVATWRIWRDKTETLPNWLAGHSLGEYTALVCAGSMHFEDAVKVVAERGRLMQTAVSPGEGAMAAILGLEDSQVVALCQQISKPDSVVAAANFNAPGQVVIAGHAGAVQIACDQAKALGARRAVILPVSVPSHCVLMKPAADKLKLILESISIQSPNIPVVHNVDVSTHSSPEVIRSLLVEQLYSPVRWSEGIRFMGDQGVGVFVECGPGKVLAGLNKRILKNKQILPVYDPGSLDKALEELDG
ncbi:MAG: malonyl CoA-ACP transacylase [Methylothermaceae bacteria B42]|nr:MAG: malonyl CoA-ACP transacylase [Methylothermaceae bacteria B42]HHJ39192.1 [acyl-carrier-protein] S-malonyltransferase [Methylothermaceae bacterium]